MLVSINSILKRFIPSSIIRQHLDVKGCVLFTFDDGPHPEVTPRILDVLDQYGARGLFFIPGNRIKRAPELIKEIVYRKHGIGNHTFTHTSCSQLSFREIRDEINKCKDELLVHSGIVTKLCRPPKGILTLSLLLAAYLCKHKIVRWSLDTGEYSYMRGASPSALADNFFKKIDDAAIVLSHDDNDTIPDFLKLVLPRLVDEGVDLKKGLLSLGWDHTS